MKKPSALAKLLEEARLQLTAAESELQAAISTLRTSPRSSKVTVSKLIEGAFEKLHVAKAKVIELQEQLLKKGSL